MRAPNAHHPHPRCRRAIAASLAVCAVLAPSPAIAGSGGTGTGTGTNCKAGSQAKISDGKAVPPCEAPRRVKEVIAAANRIAKGHPYCYGGGHGDFRSSCYDCSGAVSYALHGGNFLDSPLDSSGLGRWGRRGRGDWITVFANSGHAYAVIAGLRFDTSMTPGAGPGWSSERRSSDGYRKRHPRRF